jgi:hypothetical protein
VNYVRGLYLHQCSIDSVVISELLTIICTDYLFLFWYFKHSMWFENKKLIVIVQYKRVLSNTDQIQMNHVIILGIMTIKFTGLHTVYRFYYIDNP